MTEPQRKRPVRRRQDGDTIVLDIRIGDHIERATDAKKVIETHTVRPTRDRVGVVDVKHLLARFDRQQNWFCVLG